MDLASAQQEACTHPELVELAGHVYPIATAAGVVPVPIRRACHACGFAENGSQEGQLQPADAAELETFVHARRTLHTAIKNGTSASAAADNFPTPIWLPRIGLVPTVAPDLVAVLDGQLPEANLRERIRGHFGRTGLADAIVIHTPTGDVVVNDVYENHFFDVDPTTGRDRRDDDHLTYAALTRDTLERPIEVWLVQPGGPRTRRRAFFKLYMTGERFIYHLAVVTKGGYLLTAHRLNGGMAAFQTRRTGVPLYASY